MLYLSLEACQLPRMSPFMRVVVLGVPEFSIGMAKTNARHFRPNMSYCWIGYQKLGVLLPEDGGGVLGAPNLRCSHRKL